MIAMINVLESIIKCVWSGALVGPDVTRNKYFLPVGSPPDALCAVLLKTNVGVFFFSIIPINLAKSQWSTLEFVVEITTNVKTSAFYNIMHLYSQKHIFIPELRI